jgi:hypothetical protein
MSLWPTYNTTTSTKSAVDVKQAIHRALHEIKLNRPKPGPTHLYVDPDTYRDIIRAFKSAMEADVGLVASSIGFIHGMAIRVQSIGRKWVPPTDRFVEYDESDHDWLRRMGFGRVVEIRYAILTNMRESWDASFEMREAGIWE